MSAAGSLFWLKRPGPWLALGIVLYGVWSLARHWQARAQLPTWPVAADAPMAAPTAAINAAALDMLYGLAPRQAPVASAAPLTLRASILGGEGQSRALLAGSTGERFYPEGAQLPDGSVLRSIHAEYVLLWRNGREETLRRARPAAQHFKPAPLAAEPTPSGKTTSFLHAIPTTEAPQ